MKNITLFWKEKVKVCRLSLSSVCAFQKRKESEQYNKYQGFNYWDTAHPQNHQFPSQILCKGFPIWAMQCWSETRLLASFSFWLLNSFNLVTMEYSTIKSYKLQSLHMVNLKPLQLRLFFKDWHISRPAETDPYNVIYM